MAATISASSTPEPHSSTCLKDYCDKSVMQIQMSMLPDERTREIYRLMAASIHADAECAF